MTDKEKAKAYDEALERARRLNVDNMLSNEAIEEIFPEVAESEDERMLHKLIDHLDWHSNNRLTHKECDELRSWLEKQKECLADNSKTLADEDERARKGLQNFLWRIANGEMNDRGTMPSAKMCQEWIAYLENQKEQKQDEGDFTIYHPQKNGDGKYECIPYSFYGSLTSFSEDKDLIDFLRTCFYTEEECNEWIKQQKEQKSVSFSCGHENGTAEWSEEDENALKYIHDLISWGYSKKFMDAQTAHDMRKWVNEHLGPDTFQNGNSHWKPSEEQMEALEKVRHSFQTKELWAEINPVLYAYESLIRDLQKLL